MEVLLDSSFIVSCLRKRIDFFDELAKLGFKVVVPREVLQELKDLRLKAGQSHEVRVAIGAALDMIAQKKIKKTTLGTMSVDDGLIVKGREGIYIATLDKGIQREISNRVVITDAGNGIKIERG